jgi:AcrR family transcriptional regulator
VASQQGTQHGFADLPATVASTRDRLLRAAAELIGAHGYERASLGQLARRAGLTTGAVYSAFGSKWELLRALVAEQSRSLRLPDRSAPAGLAEDAALLAEQLHTRADGDPSRQLLVLQLEILLLGLRNPGLLEDVVADAKAERAGLAQQLRERALAEGRELPMPAEALATVLVALTQGLQLTQLLEPGAVGGQLYELAIRQLLGLQE